MCGIAGVIDRGGTIPDLSLLQRMIDTLHHRGPDNRGHYLGESAGLACARLRIVDLDTGDQPLQNEDGTLVLVCNGEIYNATELRRDLQLAGHRFRSGSDVEVILHLYEDQGPACLQRLRGMFAFALWDVRRRRLMLARDRLGIKPLYYSENARKFFFGSEQKAILASDALSRELNPRGLADLLRLGFVVAPSTLLMGIRQLPPAHYLLYDGDGTRIAEYWTPSFLTRKEHTMVNRRTLADNLLTLLDDTVCLHLRSDVPVGAWLSPGVDSSAIASLMLHHASHPIHTVSLGHEASEYDELHSAKTLDRYGGYDLDATRITISATDVDLYPLALWHAEDPSFSGIEITRYLLSRASAEKVKVVLTGEGADEVFLGYARYRVEKLLRAGAHLPYAVRLPASKLLPPPLRRGGIEKLLLAPPQMGIERFQASLRSAWMQSLFPLLTPQTRARFSDEDLGWEVPRPPEFRRWPRLSQLQYIEMKTRLPSLVIQTLDRASMACSVETRVPFLDHVLVEMAGRIPSRFKLRGMNEKAILREAVATILPPDVASRKKRGLRAPIREWMRPPLPPLADHLLSPALVRRKGYFDVARVSRLLTQHLEQKADHSHTLIALMVLHLWDEVILQARGPGL